MKAFLAYHKAHEFGPFSGDQFFSSKEIPQHHLIYVVSGDKSQANDRVTYRLEGKYMAAAVAHNKTGRFSDKEWRILLEPFSVPGTPIPLNRISELDQKWFHNNFTSGQGITELKGDKRRLLELFDNVLPLAADKHDIELIEDLRRLYEDPEIVFETEREELRNARIGQGKFRRNVIEAWGGEERCAVTGAALPALLNASHILPWRDSTNEQRLSGDNGILLCAHLDRLFDRYLIGFQEAGDPDAYPLVLSTLLRERLPDLQRVGINHMLTLDLSPLRFSARRGIESSLKEHVKKVLAS